MARLVEIGFTAAERPFRRVDIPAIWLASRAAVLDWLVRLETRCRRDACAEKELEADLRFVTEVARDAARKAADTDGDDLLSALYRSER